MPPCFLSELLLLSFLLLLLSLLLLLGQCSLAQRNSRRRFNDAKVLVKEVIQLIGNLFSPLGLGEQILSLQLDFLLALGLAGLPSPLPLRLCLCFDDLLRGNVELQHFPPERILVLCNAQCAACPGLLQLLPLHPVKHRLHLHVHLVEVLFFLRPAKNIYLRVDFAVQAWAKRSSAGLLLVLERHRVPVDVQILLLHLYSLAIDGEELLLRLFEHLPLYFVNVSLVLGLLLSLAIQLVCSSSCRPQRRKQLLQPLKSTGHCWRVAQNEGQLPRHQ
mmetsp:Transcript_6496/g.26770  ORF Transcript_6496/g.26770 Transcript_6496/m.26770 type:complete len:275 (-) Transcript_6496:280-1104(-)